MAKVSHDSETPAHGQQVFTTVAFTHYDFDGTPKVFLARRAQTKKFYPGVWELPGGHIDFGEDMKAGLAREVKEELGMNISVGDPYFEFTYTNPIKGSHSIEIAYFARFTDPIENIKIDPEDHAEFGWFAQKEIQDVMGQNRDPSDRKEIEAALEGFRLLAGGQPNFG